VVVVVGGSVVVVGGRVVVVVGGRVVVVGGKVVVVVVVGGAVVDDPGVWVVVVVGSTGEGGLDAASSPLAVPHPAARRATASSEAATLVRCRESMQPESAALASS
jgi:hypothetical protein